MHTTPPPGQRPRLAEVVCWPDSTHRSVAEFADAKALCHCQMVSKDFRDAARDEQLWEALCVPLHKDKSGLASFLLPAASSVHPSPRPEELYRRHHMLKADMAAAASRPAIPVSLGPGCDARVFGQYSILCQIYQGQNVVLSAIIGTLNRTLAPDGSLSVLQAPAQGSRGELLRTRWYHPETRLDAGTGPVGPSVCQTPPLSTSDIVFNSRPEPDPPLTVAVVLRREHDFKVACLAAGRAKAEMDLSTYPEHTGVWDRHGKSSPGDHSRLFSPRPARQRSSRPFVTTWATISRSLSTWKCLLVLARRLGMYIL